MKKRYFLMGIYIVFVWILAGCAGQSASKNEEIVSAQEPLSLPETTETEKSAEASETENVENSENRNETAASKTSEYQNMETTEESAEDGRAKKPPTEKDKIVADDEKGTESQGQNIAASEMEVQIHYHGFLFQKDEAVLMMNEDVSPALKELGNWMNYAESPSCAFRGLDKIYSYSGFDIYTYPDGQIDRINSIYFTDSSVSTPEGIRIGSSLEEIIIAYGNEYTEEYGVYSYTKEDSVLSFIVTDGVIESVEYMAVTK